MGKNKKRGRNQARAQKPKAKPLEILKWVAAILSILASLKKLFD